MNTRVLGSKACDKIGSAGTALISGAVLNRLAAELESRAPRTRPGRISPAGYSYPTAENAGQRVLRRPLGRFDGNAVYIVTQAGARRLQSQAASSLPSSTSSKAANVVTLGRSGGSVAAHPMAGTGKSGLSRLARQVKCAAILDLT